MEIKGYWIDTKSAYEGVVQTKRWGATLKIFEIKGAYCPTGEEALAAIADLESGLSEQEELKRLEGLGY